MKLSTQEENRIVELASYDPIVQKAIHHPQWKLDQVAVLVVLVEELSRARRELMNEVQKIFEIHGRP